jgi:hypothetical protein
MASEELATGVLSAAVSGSRVGELSPEEQAANITVSSTTASHNSLRS